MASKIAYIREAECIGCIKCIKACSDNAILGARKQMHTIITDLCTGCEDCIAVCPVDCIEMVESSIKTLNVEQTLQQVRNDKHFIQAPNSSSEKRNSIAEAIARTKAKRAWALGQHHDATKSTRDL